MSNIEKLFLAWQDPNSSSWFPIGQLTFDGIMYKFVYTQGAREAENTCHFKPLFSFLQLEKVYTSTSLFAVFCNRLMSPSRPDYADFLQWLNISQAEATPLVILSRSGGQRETDNYTVFPCFLLTDYNICPNLLFSELITYSCLKSYVLTDFKILTIPRH